MSQTWEFRICGKSCGQYVENVQHWANLSAGSGDPFVDSQNLIQGWRDNIEEAWIGTQGTDYEVNSYFARLVDKSLPSIQLPVSGVSGGLIQPNTVSSVGALLTFSFPNAAGHWRTAKQFLPGAPVGAISKNGLTLTYVPYLEALITAFTAGFTVSSIVYQLVSWAKTYDEPIVIQLIQVGRALGTQRRRLRPGMQAQVVG